MKATKLEELRRDVERMHAAMMDWTDTWNDADDDASASQAGTEIGKRLAAIADAMWQLEYVLDMECDCMSL